VCAQKIRLTVTSEDLLTLYQAAEELGVGTSTIYRWKDEGRLHVFRIGDQVFVTVDEVRALKEGVKNREGLLTVKQAAEELGVSTWTIHDRKEKGRLHPLRIGNQVFFTVGEVKALKEGVKKREGLLTLPQAAKELGVSAKTVYRRKDKGYLHALRIGDQMFVTVDEVKALKEKANRGSKRGDGRDV